MSKLQLKQNTTSKLIRVFVQDSSVSTGAGLTGVAWNSSGFTCYYCREGDASTTSVTLTTATLGSYTSGGWVAVDNTNMKGLYEFGIPNRALSNGASCTVVFQGSGNMVPSVMEIEITQTDNQSTGGGLTNVSSNVVQWNGSAVSAPATAGIPDVNVKNVSNVTVTTLTAQIGVNVVKYNNQTAQTDANNLPKVDTEDWLGTAGSAATAGIPDVNVKNISNVTVTTLTAQVGVNVVKYNNQTAQTDSNNLPKVDTEDWLGTAGSAATAGIPDVNVKNVSNVTVTTLTAQIGVNVVKYNNQTAQTDANNLPKVDIEDVAGAAVTTASAQIGVNVVSLASGLNFPITSNRKKGTTTTCEFTMTSSTTGADLPGLTVASIIKKDGGASTTTVNSVTDVGDGWYQLVLTATEMNANNVALQMTNVSTVTRDIWIQTQP